MQESITFPCRPEFVSLARHAVRTMLGDGGVPPVTVGVAELVTSELVTNSILWSTSGEDGSPIELLVLWDSDAQTIRIEVIDGGPRPLGDRTDQDPDQHGRGLMIVDYFTKYGHEKSKTGQIWWAELPWT